MPKRISRTDTYRAGLHLERQKFVDQERARQLMLTETRDETNGIEMFGLNLSIRELRALTAIQLLLDETDYAGQDLVPAIGTTFGRYQGPIPILKTTRAAYFDAFGLPRNGHNWFNGEGIVEACKGLIDLATNGRRIVYQRGRYDERRKEFVYDAIVEYRPILNITEGYADLKRLEAKQIHDGQDIPEKSVGLVIEPSPLLVDQIDTWFIRKPRRLYQELQEHFEKRQVRAGALLLVEWLLTLDVETISVSREKLISCAGLQSLQKERQWKRIDRELALYLGAAKATCFLTAWSQDEFGTYQLTLNRARMGRSPEKKRGTRKTKV